MTLIRYLSPRRCFGARNLLRTMRPFTFVESGKGLQRLTMSRHELPPCLLDFHKLQHQEHERRMLRFPNTSNYKQTTDALMQQRNPCSARSEVRLLQVASANIFSFTTDSRQHDPKLKTASWYQNTAKSMGCVAVCNYIERSSVLSTVTSVTVLVNVDTVVCQMR